jgi:hypothetical protein
MKVGHDVHRVRKTYTLCECSSVVERLLAKQQAEGSIPSTRSKIIEKRLGNVKTFSYLCNVEFVEMLKLKAGFV